VKRHWWGPDRKYTVPVSASIGDQTLQETVQLVASPIVPHWIQALFGRGHSLLKPVVPLVLLVVMLGAGFLLLRPPDIRVTAQPQSVLPGSTSVLAWHVERGAGGSLEYAQSNHDVNLPDGSLAVQPDSLPAICSA
jgi:hypothetical protein